MSSRQPIEIIITLTNLGNFKWIPSGTSHRIALGVQLFTENNLLFDRDYQTILIPDEVFPGDFIEFKTNLTAPDKKGRWILKFDLKKELIFWFSEKGNAVSEVFIEVT
ncbi:MAG: hypothetical protein JW755_00980 [Candidatus Aminicenantes bacterium]|nr:hypothetical protein [Candidatus Aminicenantes bacterium]